MTRHFRVEQVAINGTTGHIAIHARIVDRDGENTVVSPQEVHGIDPISMEVLHNGDIMQWHAAVRDKMIMNHETRLKAHTEAQAWVGKEWEISVPSLPPPPPPLPKI